MLRVFSVNPPRYCSNIMHAIESTPHFKEGTANERGRLKMDVVASPGPLLSEYSSFEQHGPLLDVTKSNPCAPSALDAAVNTPGSTLA